MTTKSWDQLEPRDLEPAGCREVEADSQLSALCEAAARLKGAKLAFLVVVDMKDDRLGTQAVSTMNATVISERRTALLVLAAALEQHAADYRQAAAE